mmetsp:Transcript_12115/g.35405  ORF Transcript_12115/g.35405 Transcript_12115/m.35405 type:complete len:85 (+) Transcript_12115:252-506(+)
MSSWKNTRLRSHTLTSPAPRVKAFDGWTSVKEGSLTTPWREAEKPRRMYEQMLPAGTGIHPAPAKLRRRRRKMARDGEEAGLAV